MIDGYVAGYDAWNECHPDNPEYLNDKAMSNKYEDFQTINVGDKILLYGEETTVRGFYGQYNEAIGKWETIILTNGRGDPFERSINSIEPLETRFTDIVIQPAPAPKVGEEKVLRWVKASERLPRYPGDPQNHIRIDGLKANGNFHYSIDDERREGEIVFTVIGGGLFQDYTIAKEKFDAIEFLEESEALLMPSMATQHSLFRKALSKIRFEALQSPPASSRVIFNIANKVLEEMNYINTHL